MSDFLIDGLGGGGVEEGDLVVGLALDDAGLHVAVLHAEDGLLVAVEDLLAEGRGPIR